MPAIAALTINDGAATPVAHTFSPANIDVAGVAKWEDRVGGVPLGFPTVTLSMRRPSKASRNYRLTAKVVYPVTETIAPSNFPSKAYDLIGTVEFVLPDRASLQQRKDLAAFVKNYLANAVITSCVENLDSVY